MVETVEIVGTLRRDSTDIYGGRDGRVNRDGRDITVVGTVEAVRQLRTGLDS